MIFDANSVRPESAQGSPTGLQTYECPYPGQPPPPRINFSIRALLANLGSLERDPAATAFEGNGNDGVGCNTLTHDDADANRSNSSSQTTSKNNERRRICGHNVG